MGKEKLLISSCLLGELVKYNGSHNSFDEVTITKLKNRYNLYPICPEVVGGLPTPRTPCEIVSHDSIKVLNKDGVDKTKEFLSGAKKTLELCKQENIKLALMKKNSPSCSNSQISDGTFTKTRIDGLGVTVELLIKNSVKVYNESEIEKLIF